MSSKLNQAALKQYSTDFSLKVLADFFAGKSVITGQEILSLTPSRQVNLEIISRLFEQWKKDAEAFRSPYFDFEREEVRSAMQDFMNTVSQYISVSQSDLQPLLYASTEEALVLLLTPAQYFDQKLRALPNFTLDHENARKLVKYTHIHAGVAKAISLRLTDSARDFVYVNQALSWLQNILEEGATLDDRAGYLSEFSRVLPLPLDALLPDYSPVQAPLQAAPASVMETRSFFDTAVVEASPDVPAPAVPSAPPIAPIPIAPPKPTPEVATALDNSLNSRFKVELPAESQESAYGRVQLKVDSIVNSIALGQRFMFINQLFNKNSDAFDEAMHELDNVTTFEAARELMSYKFASRYFWDMSSDAVNDLMAIVKRKFN
ncbi:hypothetical protein [Arundinibacter roseus]|uniref:Uncharacterized protein n=1 Tax=Arundinibacter roseus TaxID=2070510 RepID=A0A4R4K7R9_9BACT|nr:hypothetical protein [Arundinibacter roseus]TDB63403.1 hypothetical protein EZE20_16695 [Arundinibacter roseus]